MHYLESLFIIALILYTISIMSHYKKGQFESWMLKTFGFGLLADISGTIFLCVFASHGWQWTLHSISGLLALIIMSIHFAWAYLAFNDDKYEKIFHKYSIYAWVLWLIAFVSGIPIWS